MLIAMMSIFMVYFLSENIKIEVDKGVDSFSNYFSGDASLEKLSMGEGVGVRLGMWQVSLQIIKENFVLGVGRGGYTSSAKEYVDRGEAASIVAGHSHPHNVYIETLVSRGVVGFLVLIVVFYYPLLVFYKKRVVKPNVAIIGISFLLCLTIFSLTESMLFLKGKFVSLYLVFLMCLLVSVFYEKNGDDCTDKTFR